MPRVARSEILAPMRPARPQAPRHAPVALLLIAALGVGTGGCGSSSKRSASTAASAPTGTTPTATTPPTASTPTTPPVASTGVDALFISRGDAICGQSNGAIRPVSAQVTAEANKPAPSPTRLAALVRQVQALTQQGVARFRALRAPPQRATQVSQFVQAANRLVTLLGSYAQAIGRNDVPTVQALTKQLQAAKASEHTLAQGLGFHVCGATAG